MRTTKANLLKLFNELFTAKWNSNDYHHEFTEIILKIKPNIFIVKRVLKNPTREYFILDSIVYQPPDIYFINCCINPASPLLKYVKKSIVAEHIKNR